jgi:hypothetical protein
VPPPTDLVDFDKKPVNHCVALKRVNTSQERLDNEVGILKEFATLVDEQRRHILTIYER